MVGWNVVGVDGGMVECGWSWWWYGGVKLELVVVWWRVVGVGGDMVECGWSWWGDAEKGMKLMVSVKR